MKKNTGNNFKQADRKKVLDFLAKQDLVGVEDILQGTSIEELRLYPILFRAETREPYPCL